MVRCTCGYDDSEEMTGHARFCATNLFPKPDSQTLHILRRLEEIELRQRRIIDLLDSIASRGNRSPSQARCDRNVLHDMGLEYPS
jgi:hypothetical protein